MTVLKISDAALMLADLVRRAASGEEVLLAHHWQPVARISAVDQRDQARYHRDEIERPSIP